MDAAGHRENSPLVEIVGRSAGTGQGSKNFKESQAAQLQDFPRSQMASQIAAGRLAGEESGAPLNLD